MASGDASGWARRASALYDAEYAKRYRVHDDGFGDGGPYQQFVDWLREICRLVPAPFDALDLGCGTGRYFWALQGVRRLVGIDASAPMLAEARHPLHANRITAASVELIEGDIFTHDFGTGAFDLVYAIGVLAEHTPLDPAVVTAIARWIKPGGRFAFTTVHPDSPSVPPTWSRRIGRAAARIAPPGLRRRLHDRLLAGGLYADEARVRKLLAAAFDIESLALVESEAHLHCLCVARRKTS